MPTKALIPLPTTITPTEFTCYQFNVPTDVEWRAMFWGALDQLTRWNSYERSPGFPLGVAVANTWKDIVAEARASACPDTACPSAFLYEDLIPGITQGHDNLRNYWPLDQCTLNCIGGNPNAYNGWVTLHGFALKTEESLIFVDGDYNSVGTHVCELRAERIGGFATWFFTLKWQNCLGLVQTQTFAPPANRLEKLNFEAKWIWIECNTDFNWTLTFDGPILCGPA